MTDEQKDENEVTPKGAVEVEEEDLDQASGGSLNFTKPGESDSVGYSKISYDLAGQKVAPADPSIGLLSDTQKKI